MALWSALYIGFGVLASLLDIPSNIKGVTWRFRNGQSIVQSDAARDRTEADDHAPHLVYREIADTVTRRCRLGGQK